MIPDCQRWRERRDTYRPAGEPIDTSRYGVEVVEQREAKPFVLQHHYSGSYPAARLAVGLWRKQPWLRPELAGVAVFSVGVQPAAVKRWCGTPDAIELGRFVLLDDVPANGETWFLRRAFAELIATLPEVRACLAYSDPVQRASADGAIVLPGHVGTIYQAHNGRYVGRGTRRTIHLYPDGRAVSGRTETKIRKGEKGAGPEIDRLVAAGARCPRLGEDPVMWLDEVLHAPPFRALRHPGNHAYVWPVDGRKSTTKLLAPNAGAYPKRVDAITSP